MMSNEEVMRLISEIAENENRYDKEAFMLVLVGLEHTLSKLPERRHLSGQELSIGIAEFAREQYGFMAKLVMSQWGINVTLDFGEIVYLLIEHSVLTKTENDSKDDFEDVFNFDEEFDWHKLQPGEFPERL